MLHDFLRTKNKSAERAKPRGCCRGFERNRIPRAKPKRTVSSHEKTRDAPLFFLRVREPCVNARPRPVRRRAVRCLRPRPTPPRGVGPGPTRPPRRLGNARRGRRGAPALASPLGARRPEPHDRYPRARIVRAVEARRGARARRPPVRGATVGRSMMDEPSASWLVRSGRTADFEISGAATGSGKPDGLITRGSRAFDRPRGALGVAIFRPGFTTRGFPPTRAFALAPRNHPVWIFPTPFSYSPVGGNVPTPRRVALAIRTHALHARVRSPFGCSPPRTTAPRRSARCARATRGTSLPARAVPPPRPPPAAPAA